MITWWQLTNILGSADWENLPPRKIEPILWVETHHQAELTVFIAMMPGVTYISPMMRDNFILWTVTWRKSKDASQGSSQRNLRMRREFKPAREVGWNVWLSRGIGRRFKRWTKFKNSIIQEWTTLRPIETLFSSERRPFRSTDPLTISRSTSEQPKEEQK